MIILTNLLLEYYHTILLSLTTNLPYLYSFILENPSFYDPLLFDHFLHSLTSFIHHLTFVLHDLFFVISYLLLFILKLSLILMPYVHSFGVLVVEFHQKQLKPIDIVIEISVILVCFIYFLFRKRIFKFWESFYRNLSQKYQKFAKIFPHILFFLTAGILAIYGGKFLIPLSSPQILPIFTLIRPLFHSFRLWKAAKPNPKAQKDAVVLWTILGSYYALSSFAMMIPFSNYFLSYIPAVREFSLVIAIWIQISPVCANLVFESTVPLIHFYTNQIPIADLASSTGISHLLEGLKFVGLPEAVLTSIRGLLNDGSALVITILFFFLPFSSVGALIISLLLPAYKSSLVLVQSSLPSQPQHDSQPHSTSTIQKSYNLLTSWFQSSSSQKQKTEKKSPIQSNPILFWLEYWMCLAVLLILQTYGVIRLWPTSSMILCLWLQNSHFCGATMIFRWVTKLFQDIASYEKTRSITAPPPSPPPSPPQTPTSASAPAPTTVDSTPSAPTPIPSSIVAPPPSPPSSPPPPAVAVYVDDVFTPEGNLVEEEEEAPLGNNASDQDLPSRVTEEEEKIIEEDEDICLVESVVGRD